MQNFERELSTVAKLVFSFYFRSNYWGGDESRSGKGSALDRGHFLRERVPLVIKGLGVRSILDAACGDMNWMKHMPLDGVKYIGTDIVADIIQENRKKFAADGMEFLELDACIDALPDVDLIFCRDMLTHIPNKLVSAFLSNVAASSAKWLICSRYLGKLGQLEINTDIPVGGFRAIDLCENPFNLPPPALMVPELFHKWKSLGLWNVDVIRTAFGGHCLGNPASGTKSA